MISLRPVFSLWIAAIAAVSVAPAASTAPSPLGGKTSAEAAARAAKVSERIAQRIDALLGQRLKPEPLPRNPPNPFIVNGIAAVQRGDAVDPEPAPGDEADKAASTADRQAEERAAFSDAELLARYVAGLKLGGMITLNDQPRIVINDIPRREGDPISVKYDGAEVRIQLIRILPGTITFRFNEAEQTIKY